jgi:hypothetical protein
MTLMFTRKPHIVGVGSTRGVVVEFHEWSYIYR